MSILPWPTTLSVSRALAVGLAVLTAGLAGHALISAAWTPGVARLWLVAALGILCGFGLGATRWPWPAATGYSVVLGLAISLERAFDLIPWAVGLSRETLDLLRVRLWALGEAVHVWWAAVAAGGTLTDTRLFDLTASMVLWQLLAALGWAVVRRRGLWPPVIALSGALALNHALAGLDAVVLVAIVVTLLGLIAVAQWERQRWAWATAQIDSPEDLWDHVLPTVLLSLAAAALVGLALPWVGTPQGWRAVAAWFERPAAQAASQLFAAVRPPERGGDAGVVARAPDLTRIGSPLPNGAGVVMWVRTSDPPPPPPELSRSTGTPIRYWRNTIYGDYTGQGWLRVAADPAVQLDWPDAAARLLRQTFEIAAEHGAELYAVNRPVSTTVPSGLIALGPHDALLVGGDSLYQVDSAVPDLDQLQPSASAWETVEARPYRALPDTLPERVRGLAAAITADAPTDLEKALAVQRYLRETYPYDLGAPLAPVGRDVVDDFLFDTRRGFCSHFASAMVVLLRAGNVPARVAAGYAMGAYDQGRGAWRVTEADAHAWVEVLVPDVGWVEFEPTPSQPERAYTLSQGAVPTAGSPSEPARPPEPRTGLTLLGLIGAIAALILGALWRARHEARPLSVRVIELYGEMVAGLALAGVPGGPEQTPAERVAAVRAMLSRWPTLTTASLVITDVYVVTLFSPRAASHDDLWRAQGLWQRARWECLDVILRRAWRALTRRLHRRG